MGCDPRLESLETRRLFSNADLDPTFGHSGQVGVDLGRHGGFEDMILQPDGKILTVGAITSPSGRTSDALVMRFNTDGSFDTSFGEGGLVRFDRGAHEDFQSVVLRSDGSFVAGGQLTDQNYVLVAYHADGSIDTTFGGDDGVTKVGGRFAAMALQSDKILSVTAGGKLRRHNGDGSIDTGFAGGDFIDMGPLFARDGGPRDVEGAHTDIQTLSVEPNGGIVVGGQVGFSVDGDSLEDSVLFRLETDGTYDWDETSGLGKFVERVAVQPDGRILASVEGDLYRLNSDGSSDTTFGDLVFPDTSRVDGAGGRAGIAVQLDGKVVTATDDFSAKRFLIDGAPDESFSGGDGTAIDRAAGEFAVANALALAADGGILVGGTTGRGEDNSARFADDARRIATIAKFVANPAPAIAHNVRLADGKLHIEGTADGDNLALTSEDNAVRLEMNGEAMTFDLADVQLVTAALGEGDDTLQILGSFPRRVTIHGEGGDDFITGTNREDSLTGGDGADVLLGRGGDDILFGGADRDIVSGEDGNDLIDGGAHDDELRGGSGIDTLFGQSGNDWFRTIDQMMDSLFGGPGNDRVDGDEIDELASVEQINS